MTKSFSMAGWRVASWSATARSSPRSTKLKSYLDYGTFQPIQIAATVTLNEAPDYPKVVNEMYQARRDTLCGGLNRIGWPVEPPRGDDVRVGADPRALPRDGLGRVRLLPGRARPRWRCRPGSGFGPGGDGHVRFALIENEQRTNQAIRNLRKALTKLG